MALPIFADRSVRAKPLARLHILPAWQRAQVNGAKVEQQALPHAPSPLPSAPPSASLQEGPRAAASAPSVADPGIFHVDAPTCSTALEPFAASAARAAPPRPPVPDAPVPVSASSGPAPNPGPDAPQRAIIRIGALRVLQLGVPQPSQASFHNRHQVLPLGFTSIRRFHDVLRVNARCDYTCEIRESSGTPWFVITHSRDRSVSFRGRTATEAWSQLVSRRYKQLHSRPPTLPPAKAALDARIFFGFGAPAIAQLIEQLPGTKSCEGFKPRYSLPEARQRDPPPPVSVTGCARTDGLVRRSSNYKNSHQMYYRPFINRGELPYKRAAGSEETAAEALLMDERSSLNLRKRDVPELKSAAQVERSAVGVVAMLKQAHPVRVGRSAIHNWGLFTTRAVPKDGMVVEYMGSAMRNSLADHKEKVYENGAFAGQGGDCYMFRLDGECVIDATMRGNIARYINHCCTPNCYSKVIVEPEGEPYVPGSVKGHIVIFALRDLEADEEVTYDYKFPVEAAKIACHCGSPRCLGVMCAIASLDCATSPLFLVSSDGAVPTADPEARAPYTQELRHSVSPSTCLAERARWCQRKATWAGKLGFLSGDRRCDVHACGWCGSQEKHTAPCRALRFGMYLPFGGGTPGATA